MTVARVGLCDFPTLSKKNKTLVCLAALMHDIDDRKIFPNSSNYDNARLFLGITLRLCLMSKRDAYKVLRMIQLVSYSKNKNKVYPHDGLWMYLPRDADRVTAGGCMGITRTLEFNDHNATFGKCPMYTDADKQMILEAGFNQLDFNRFCLNHFVEKFKDAIETDRSSIFRFYLTDWVNREYCASRSPRLTRMLKKEYDILAKWVVLMIRHKATKTSNALSLINLVVAESIN